MIVKTSVKAVVYPDALAAQCTKAEHAVAVQAERDSRRYIPAASGKLRRSGRVYGNTIVWDLPYAREQYFGNLYVDPLRKIGGFPTAGGWRSFKGRQKVRSERKMRHSSGGEQWFTAAKKAHIKSWYALAQGVIERGR